MQYLKFLAGQNDAQAIFLEDQNRFFRIFMRQNPGLRVKREPWYTDINWLVVLGFNATLTA